MSDAGGLVLAWVGWYTRDLPEPLAQQRRAELASDVWEQQHDDGAGGSLLGRALRGAPADLAWRRRTLLGAPDRPPLHLRWERSGLLAVVVAEGAVLLALLGAALVKTVVGGNAGVLGPGAAGVLAIEVLAVVAVLAALVMALPRRSRWAAPLLLLAALVVLVVVAVPAVVQVSTTASELWLASPFIRSHPSWHDVAAVVLGFAAVFHLAVALAWAPARRRAS